MNELLSSSAAPSLCVASLHGKLPRQRRFRVIREVVPGAAEAYAIGERVREARLRLGLRQDDLSNATGIARPNIARIEYGKHTPSVPSLAKIAKALGVSVQSLLAPVQPTPMTDEEKQLAEAGMQDFVEALEREDKRA
ncbi:MAG: helix-turn-helix transcriptional regulator [Planctomycetota bacterium]